MKKAEIIKKAIKDSKSVHTTNLYKWTYKDGKLYWSYLGEKDYFIIDIHEIDEEITSIHVKLHYNNCSEDESFICVIVGDVFYSDAKTLEDGLDKAIKRTIIKANNTF